MRPAVAATAAVAGLGAASLAYAWGYERKAFRLRRYDVPVLPAGAPPIKVLHVSDLHATPGQPWKVEWVAALARTRARPRHRHRRQPRVTGRSAGRARGARTRCSTGPAGSCPASNDWFAPRPKNPARYLLPDRGHRIHGERLPWGELRSAFTARGWLDLTHRRERRRRPRGDASSSAGVERRRTCNATTTSASPARSTRRRRRDRAVTHAPSPGLLDAFTADGFALVLVGPHPRRPAAGARASARSSPTAAWTARRARGLSPWPEQRLAARVGRAGHLAVRPGAVRLPARKPPC